MPDLLNYILEIELFGKIFKMKLDTIINNGVDVKVNTKNIEFME